MDVGTKFWEACVLSLAITTTNDYHNQQSRHHTSFNSRYTPYFIIWASSFAVPIDFDSDQCLLTVSQWTVTARSSNILTFHVLDARLRVSRGSLSLTITSIPPTFSLPVHSILYITYHLEDICMCITFDNIGFCSFATWSSMHRKVRNCRCCWYLLFYHSQPFIGGSRDWAIECCVTSDKLQDLRIWLELILHLDSNQVFRF